ncbi:hypothetical protein ACP3V3_02985 [Vibrio sp. PNB22_3_1]
MRKIIFICALFTPSAMAELKTVNSSSALSSLWNTMWPGTWGSLETFSSASVSAFFLLFAAWVTMGLYKASIVTGQITFGEAGIILFRMFILLMALFAIMNS